MDEWLGSFGRLWGLEVRIANGLVDWRGSGVRHASWSVGLFDDTVFGIMKIVMDTNVLFAGLYSANGASFKVLKLLSAGALQLYLSTPLLFEYEDVLKRNQVLLNLTTTDIDCILDNLCAFSEHQQVYFLWRPYLPDPKDDLILELAVASGASTLVTHNLKDFVGSDAFGVEAITPKQLLERFTWAH